MTFNSPIPIRRGTAEYADQIERREEQDGRAKRAAFELFLEAELDKLDEDSFRGNNPNLGPTWEQAIADRERELRDEFGYEKGTK